MIPGEHKPGVQNPASSNQSFSMVSSGEASRKIDWASSFVQSTSNTYCRTEIGVRSVKTVNMLVIGLQKISRRMIYGLSVLYFLEEITRLCLSIVQLFEYAGCRTSDFSVPNSWDMDTCPRHVTSTTVNNAVSMPIEL